MSNKLKAAIASLKIPLTEVVNVNDLAKKHKIHRSTAAKYLRGEWAAHTEPLAKLVVQDALKIIKYMYGATLEIEDIMLLQEEAQAPQ